MERLNARRIHAEIAQKTKNQMLQLKYEKIDEPYPIWEQQETDYLGNVLNTKFAWSSNIRRYRFIYKVISSHLYYKEEGAKLKITDSEIQEAYNKYYRRLEVIANFEHIEEFKLKLLREAREVIETEAAEIEEFKNKGLLRQFLDTDSTLQLQIKEIERTRTTLKKLNNEMKVAILRWQDKKLSGMELDALRDVKDEVIQHYKNKLIRISKKYKNTSESKEYRRRKYLKDCFGTDALYSTETSQDIEFEPRNSTALKFIIDRYCAWFNNEKFSSQIKQQQKVKKNLKKRLDRKENPSDRTVETLRRTEILKEYIDSKMSYGQIAEETNISKSSVYRILSKLRSN